MGSGRGRGSCPRGPGAWQAVVEPSRPSRPGSPPEDACRLQIYAGRAISWFELQFWFLRASTAAAGHSVAGCIHVAASSSPPSLLPISAAVHQALRAGRAAVHLDGAWLADEGRRCGQACAGAGLELVSPDLYCLLANWSAWVCSLRMWHASWGAPKAPQGSCGASCSK